MQTTLTPYYGNSYVNQHGCDTGLYSIRNDQSGPQQVPPHYFATAAGCSPGCGTESIKLHPNYPCACYHLGVADAAELAVSRLNPRVSTGSPGSSCLPPLFGIYSGGGTSSQTGPPPYDNYGCGNIYGLDDGPYKRQGDFPAAKTTEPHKSTILQEGESESTRFQRLDHVQSYLQGDPAGDPSPTLRREGNTFIYNPKFRMEPRMHWWNKPTTRMKKWAEKMLSQGWIEQVQERPQVCLQVNLIPKQGGGQRTTMNCKRLDEYLQRYPTKRLAAYDIIQYAIQHQYVTKVDLKDAYFNIVLYHRIGY
eukprot:Protomagalhaensia_wolfi_Nauph_80__1997@NODE_2264_length_1145_cov_88_241410_g1769_i0_p1_GENE_NODE_2264_length_1145_cov_88_241410_g1769_i0NODE_2264_length_1145_cov_88_241410_g1769_i0_p1_ORF_typecomplete_len307_score21_95Resistin/PF06954_11/0_43_NODE_2264_length_1145_cov_88_241410_g1769_i01301050